MIWYIFGEPGGWKNCPGALLGHPSPGKPSHQ